MKSFPNISALIMLVMCGCQDPTTGWDYNNPSNSCFAADSGADRDTGLILMEGDNYEMSPGSGQDTSLILKE